MSNKEMLEQGQSEAGQKTTGRAWLMFVVIFFMCFITPILWFSAPPLHNSIAGLLVNGEFMVQPGYTVFFESFSNQALFGQTMSLIGLGGFIAAIFTSPLVRRLGVKGVMLIGISLVVVSAAVSALSGSDFTVLCVGRFILGMAVACIWVTSPTAISLWFPEKNRGLAMGIWGACVPVGSLAATNLIVNPMLSSGVDFHTIWWLMAAIALVALLLIAFVYKNPEGNTEVSVESKPFKEIWPVLKQHQLLMVIIVWMVFNFVNSCFTSYNNTFFQDSLGMDYLTANGWASLASGAGIVAPIFGFIADRINRYRRWILVSIGALCLLLSGLFGFHTELGPLGGTAIMIVYLVIIFCANGILIATIRPYIPMLVGRGGASAVAVGFALLTMLQFGVQFLTAPVFGGVQDAAIVAGATSAMAWAEAAQFVIVPAGALALVCSFFIRQSKQEKK